MADNEMVEDINNLEEEVQQEDVTQDEENQGAEAEGQQQDDVQSEEDKKKEEELAIKRQQYEERQKRKKEQQERQRELQEKADNVKPQDDIDEIEYLKKEAQERRIEKILEQDAHAYSILEKEFVEAYPDYSDKVKTAMEFTKKNLVNKGYSEMQAAKLIEREKIMLANEAAARGEDPAKAVYKEADSICGLIDDFAKEMGYTKLGQNLDGVRKINRAVPQGGSGASATKKDLNDDDNNDINEMTLGEMIKAKKAGLL